MKGIARLLAVCALVALGLVLCTAGVRAADVPAGQQVFVDQKCGNCHAVSSAAIESKMKGGADLAGIGAKKDAAWLKSYISQQQDVDGKKHKVGFKGTPEQLDQLVAWLGTLK